MISTGDFTFSISVNLTARDTVKKICSVSDWWGVTCTGSADKQNDTFIVTMTGDSFFNFTVTELIPGRRIVWLVTDCNMPWYSDKKEWAGTRLIFDLHEHDGVTEVKFTHEGLTTEVECYKDCAPGWTHWIGTSLKSYLTTGKGVFRPPTK
ncbi:MAG TPA: SRPBCC domain-containing protein [Bacteroidota bacterium]|nr:SRPBCC domain-containing protein [Bacteroidota bacterium]